MHIEFIVTSHNSVIGDTYKKKGVKWWGERVKRKKQKLRNVIYGRPLVYQSLLTTTTTIYLYLATLDNHFSVTIVERGIATHTRQPLLLPRSVLYPSEA